MHILQNAPACATSLPFPLAGDGAGGPACGVSREPAQAETAPLGINAKSASIGSGIESGAIKINRAFAAFSRFALQNTVRGLLPKSRTAKCLRITAFNSDVQVWKSTEFNTANYAGLQTCSSVWSCPVCSAKISERRRVELKAAIAMHRAAGGSVLLLTLTVPHHATDSLADLLLKQRHALKRFWSDRASKSLFETLGLIGQVRAYEVTHGRMRLVNNGWHPHFHYLLFIDASLATDDRESFEVEIWLRWRVACVAKGLGSPSFKHGISLDDDIDSIADYVTKSGTDADSKWGLESEMTRGHSKRSSHGETPFDLLRAYFTNKEDKQAAALFIEYSQAFFGLAQLFWSRGLKARFAIEEKTDSEVADEAIEESFLLGLITPEQWRDVLKVDARAKVLHIASEADWATVQRFLELLDGCRVNPLFPHEVQEMHELLLQLYKLQNVACSDT